MSLPYSTLFNISYLANFIGLVNFKGLNSEKLIDSSPYHHDNILSSCGSCFSNLRTKSIEDCNKLIKVDSGKLSKDCILAELLASSLKGEAWT